MIARMIIAPLYGDGASGDVLRSIEENFSTDDSSNAANKFGITIFEAINACRRVDPSISAFDLTIEVDIEPEDDEPTRQQFFIVETNRYRVIANSEEEAERIWIDKGEDAIVVGPTLIDRKVEPIK